MMRLRPYKSSDARVILGWVKDEYSFFRWSAGILGSYPITAEEMNHHYEALQEDETHWGMTAFDESGIVGHFSFRFVDCTKETVRLGFVILDDTRRGCGLGKALVEMAQCYAKVFLKVERVTLGVFSDNMSARHCYERVGFTLTGEVPKTYRLNAEEIECLEMEWSTEGLGNKACAGMAEKAV